MFINLSATKKVNFINQVPNLKPPSGIEPANMTRKQALASLSSSFHAV